MTKIPASPHITQLNIENVKRIKVARITPDGQLIQITGANGSGKSSVLDSILWALGGAKEIERVPIRRGEESARIEVGLGAITVTRKFNESGTTTLTIKGEHGETYGKAQATLDEMIGALTLDPLAFDRMEPKKRLEVLRGIVPVSVDLDEIDARNRGDYETRRDVGRTVAALEAKLASMPPYDASAPAEHIDVAPLVEKMAGASEHNAKITAEQYKRDQTTARADGVSRLIKDRERQIAELQQQIDGLRTELYEVHAEMKAWPDLPATLDTAELTAEVERVRDVNAAVSRNEMRRKVEHDLQEHTAIVTTLTQAMQQRDAIKAGAIAAAPMPVPGLSFGDGDVLFNGLPYDQASGAERLRISLAIAMHGNPALRVIRIKDGSLLDPASLALVADAAREHDFQVWIERVDVSGEVGIVMEDGEVKGA